MSGVVTWAMCSVARRGKPPTAPTLLGEETAGRVSSPKCHGPLESSMTPPGVMLSVGPGGGWVRQEEMEWGRAGKADCFWCE